MTIFAIDAAKVQQAHDILISAGGPDAAKGLHQVLQDGKEIEESGLTPVYFYNDETETIIATSVERMTKKLDG